MKYIQIDFCSNTFFFLIFYLLDSTPICSNVQNATSFQHMARMMDSLILNDFPPYAFTKITTTHRPTRNNGMASSKLLAKSTANISSSAANLNNNNHNNSNANGITVASVLGMNGGLRQTPSQKSKVPMQGISISNENRVQFEFHKAHLVKIEFFILYSLDLNGTTISLYEKAEEKCVFILRILQIDFSILSQNQRK